MSNADSLVRANAVISELEAQRNIMSVRATQLAQELAVKTTLANSLYSENTELKKMNEELKNQLDSLD